MKTNEFIGWLLALSVAYIEGWARSYIVLTPPVNSMYTVGWIQQIFRIFCKDSPPSTILPFLAMAVRCSDWMTSKFDSWVLCPLRIQKRALLGVRRWLMTEDNKKQSLANVRITGHLQESRKKRKRKREPKKKSQEGRVVAVSPVTCPECCVTPEISKGKRREKERKEKI